MKSIQFLIPFLAATASLCSPTPTVEKRATTKCGQWDTITTGTFTVYQDLWGESSASSGSQCTTVTSDTSGTLVWSTKWTWAGGSNSVKSYASAVGAFTPKKMSALSTIPSTWKWSYTGSNLVADVAYDIFTSSSSTGSNEYELMIWLAALGGAGPISSTGSPIATPTIAGHSWKLFKGPNGSTTVYSFVATSQINNFSADLALFIKYLESSWGFPSSQYLLNIGAGTEPFTGSNAVFSTSAYKTVVN